MEQYIGAVRSFLKEVKPLEAVTTPAVPKLGTFKPKAVVFDIYGTLLISASGDVDGAEFDSSMMAKALLAASFDVLKDTKEAYNRAFEIYTQCLANHYQMGRDEGRPYPEVDIIAVWEDTFELVAKEGIAKATPASDIRLFIFVFELQTNKVWPMPGMEEVIKQLGKTELEMGIVSNAQFYTPVILNHFLHDKEIGGADVEPFNPEISVYSFQYLTGKPDVALYENLLPGFEKLGIKPEEVLYVGNDMLKDTYAATQLGMKTVFFAGDQRAYRLHEGDERVADIKSDFIITELKQLLEIIKL